MPPISKSAFARKQKISAGRVSQYIKTQILKDCLLPDGKLDEDLAIIELDRNVDGAKRIDYRVRVGIDPKKDGGGSGPSGKQKSAEPRTRKQVAKVEVYEVARAFIEKFGKEKFLIPAGTIMKVYDKKGEGRVEVAFFPKRKEG